VAYLFLAEPLDSGEALRGAEPFGLVQYQYAVLLFHAKEFLSFKFLVRPAEKRRKTLWEARFP
jgi:hypothetical protein